QAREVLRPLLEASANATVGSAAAEASLAPAARAARLIDAAQALLAADDDPARRLRLEAVAREIDAGFAADARPPALAEVRAAIVRALGAAA
ncbi:MAG: AAA family ATPase, partial [Deltaproteobacteria bacterium]|nr:AAA family ATPase [Deltaproteobacteria bacterium]